MNTKNGCPIGVCNWSLKQDLAGTIRSLQVMGISHVHLGVRPALQEGGEEFVRAVRLAGWTITSAMIGCAQEDYSSLDSIRQTGGIVPDATWPSNRETFGRAADVAAALGTPCISMHAGFLDHRDSQAASVFYRRMSDLADAAGQRGLTLLMETGQETAADLRRFMEDLKHPALGINLDPANMILYDKGDPIEAVRQLAPWIRHVHIKDALRTKTPGQWGKEVPWGDGEVGAPAFLAALSEIGYRGPLAIEREGGESRMDDIRKAISRLSA
ncbi:MAG: sugar phosphate isomerase/epimerase family protein [Kiritimatiellia bacterium]|nr:sugar phosphate isomerase/epimerase family protein [Kiritimatiellia bacterium]